MMVPKPK